MIYQIQYWRRTRYTRTRAGINTYIHARIHTYRQVKCGCGFIVCLRSSQHYPRYTIYIFRSSEAETRARREKDFPQQTKQKQKKTNKEHKKRRERTPQIDSLRVAIRCDLDTPGVTQPGSLDTAKQKRKLLVLRVRKAKGKGIGPAVSPFFSISFSSYLYLSISLFSIFLSLTLFLSLALARPSFLDWSTGNILESTTR